MSTGLLTAPTVASDGEKDTDTPLILVLGDSLSAGYGLAKADSFPEKLESTLQQQGQPVRVINAGVSGDTSQGGLSRVDWLLTDNPDLMILALGANDGLRALDPKQTEANLAAIIEKAKAQGVHVLLAGMLAPPNLGQDYGQSFNALYPRLNEQYDVTYYPFILEGVAADPALNLDDGMHPNEKGVEKMVEKILPTVRNALDKALHKATIE